MATLRISTGLRNALANAITAFLDGSSGSPNNAYIEIYTGSMPANPQTAISTQTKLGTLLFAVPSFGSPSTGVITANVISRDDSADATGTAAWARVIRGDGSVAFDADVTATGGGGTIEFNTVSFVSGGPIEISSFTLTVPQ
jgi:hypothetical protein